MQKDQPITDQQFTILKRKKLIEGRRPNLFVSASVATVTDQQAAYIRNRGLDKAHYKGLVMEYLRRYKQATLRNISATSKTSISSSALIIFRTV